MSPLDGSEFQIAELKGEIERLKLLTIEHPICRLQLPDGTVPTDNVSALIGWKTAYNKLLTSWAELKAEHEKLRDWRADVTVALHNPGGSHFADVPGAVYRLQSAYHRLVHAVAPELGHDGAATASPSAIVQQAERHRECAEQFPSQNEIAWSDLAADGGLPESRILAPKPCRHQYWDLGRCASCLKTQHEIDNEKTT